VPGTLEPITSADQVVAFGEQHGWPVAIKAAFGGGGRGMKVVDSPDEAQSALDSAARESQAYFGRPETYLERYLTRPRHIEIQVFADTQGNTVWLGERDCSTQRRHQKLIEETPAPGLADDVRAAMGEAAVKVAKACGYLNAGTVECLYQDGGFWFLEMNTRLQVEHCVTEMVTSLDLVAEQLRVAAGEPLSFTQQSVERRGHSFECRINAEDPAKNFLPSPGTITRLRVPSGPGVRWDGGYDEGDTISQFYDNLVGKLVVWGADREAARRRMLRALRELEVDGVRTTVPADLALLDHPDFVAGNHSTRWLEEEVDPALLAAAAPAPAPVSPGAAADAAAAGARRGGKVSKPRLAAGGGGGGDGTVSSPMQGTIVKVLVAQDDAVEPGQALLVLEAMKMENHINAERGGTVKEVRVAAGDTVGTGDVLIVIE
jgi:acetyl-CoA/propionyl-CoA carboxylase biotin carboxyl carrier protein